MTLQEARNHFEELINQTDSKSKVKVYTKFLHLINSLESKKIETEKLEVIEAELDQIREQSQASKSKRKLQTAYAQFERFLKDRFSFTLKGYFTSRGIALGASFGIIFGIVFLSNFERSLGIALGLSFGMLIGVVIGKSMDTKAETAGNII